MNARMPCAVSQDLARHEAAEERATAHDEAVESRVMILMAPGAAYWPLSAENLTYAICEADKAFFVKLSAALAGDSRSALGCDVVRAEAEAYWLPMATEQAEDELNAEREAALESAAEMRAESAREIDYHGYDGVG
jgi:hypothetical protein